MEKTRFLTILSIGLLLSNLLLAGYFLSGRSDTGKRPGPMPPPARQPKEIVSSRLHFTEAQTIRYDSLISLHRSKIKEADRKIINLKKRLYSSLAQTELQGEKDSLIDAIAATQKEIEQTHYRHFQDIGNLCTPDQKDDYLQLTKELASLFAAHPPRPPKP